MNRHPAFLWSLALLALVGFLAAALTSADGAPAPGTAAEGARASAALLFVLLGPGLGWAGALRPSGWALTLLVGVGTSVALTLLVAVGMAASNTWTVGGGFAALASIGGIGALAWVLRSGGVTADGEERA